MKATIGAVAGATATVGAFGASSVQAGMEFDSSMSQVAATMGKTMDELEKEKGIDKDKIYRSVYNNYSPNRVRLMGYVMYEKLQVIENFNACIFTITRAEQRRFRFMKGDAEGLVNIPLTIKGTRLSISLREDTDKDRILVSLRSVDDFPCNKMAEEFFNGGGHLNASGGKLYCTMEEAIETAKRAIFHYEKLLVAKK